MDYSIADFLFSIKRAYNRYIGKYIFNITDQGVMIFGAFFILKSSVDFINSPEANANLYYGLSPSEIRELDETLGFIRILPKPELPNGLFSDDQKNDYGITLIANTFYMCSIN